MLETWIGGAELSVLRTLRVLRVVRILREVEELRLTTSVLPKSVMSLGFSGVLFFVFMYDCAVMGVSLFVQDKLSQIPN